MKADRGAPLHIGVVAYEMEGRPTGVGRYLEGLLGGLVANQVDARLTLFMKGERFEHALWDPRSGDDRISPMFDRRPNARPVAWEQLRLPRLLRRLPLDLVFSPSYSLPPRLPAPGIVTIHDLSFEHLPGAFSRRERWRRRLLARRAAHRAERVLADTERIAAELIGAYDLPPERVAVVPLAVSDHFSPEVQGDDAERVASVGARSPYLLVVGSVLERRRLDLALAAFDELARARRDLRLVIVGANRLPRPRRLDQWLAQTAARDRVCHLDWIDDTHLPALYRRAAAAMYLSTYEGFGLPPLEALACATPCVVSEGLGLDDLWPEYPLRTALDKGAVVAALTHALSPDGERIARQGRERMARLDWRHAAERFYAEARCVTAAAEAHA